MKEMLQSLGKASLYLRLMSWVCVCMRQKLLPAEFVERIQPLRIGAYCCWCDRRN